MRRPLGLSMLSHAFLHPDTSLGPVVLAARVCLKGLKPSPIQINPSIKAAVYRPCSDSISPRFSRSSSYSSSEEETVHYQCKDYDVIIRRNLRFCQPPRKKSQGHANVCDYKTCNLRSASFRLFTVSNVRRLECNVLWVACV